MKAGNCFLSSRRDRAAVGAGRGDRGGFFTGRGLSAAHRSPGRFHAIAFSGCLPEFIPRPPRFRFPRYAAGRRAGYTRLPVRFLRFTARQIAAGLRERFRWNASAANGARRELLKCVRRILQRGSRDLKDSVGNVVFHAPPASSSFPRSPPSSSRTCFLLFDLFRVRIGFLSHLFPFGLIEDPLAAVGERRRLTELRPRVDFGNFGANGPVSRGERWPVNRPWILLTQELRRFLEVSVLKFLHEARVYVYFSRAAIRSLISASYSVKPCICVTI